MLDLSGILNPANSAEKLDMDSLHAPNEVTFEPGDFLIREKTPCDILYIIVEGQLEVFKRGPKGQKVPLGVVVSGQYVGEMALLLNAQNTSNVVALTPVRAIKLPKAVIDAQLKSVPGWLLTLTKGLIERLNHGNELLRRNGWVDKSLAGQTSAIKEKFKRRA